ncbi:RND transporter [Lamprobacter modestohalophilus]|uniref:RND transporter n=1 Tax=Lamprobacter modestohalophilus TaxID=1064514 RepID=A0A9X1B2W9_9GAMM|nr:MMPL family transporter [Lamprobacter modestohalophilus]MBK1617384.1 RND transporter [Lamprobacter modestohalophilus]
MKRIHLPASLALSILLLTSLAGGVILTWLQVNNAPDTYFPPSVPTVQFEHQLRETFPTDEVLVALFEGQDLFEDSFLEPFLRLTQRMEQLSQVDRVLAVGAFDQIRGTADGFAVEPLLSADLLDQLDPDQRRARVLNDRFAPGLLVTTDGTGFSLIIRPKTLDGSLQRLALQQALLDAIAEEGLSDQHTALAGQLAVDVAELHAMLHDILIFVPGTLAIGLFVVWLLFRRLLAVVVSALTISAVTLLTLALLVLAGQPFTLIAAILPPLMSALTLASLIHWFNAMAHAAQRGLTGKERIDWAYAQVAKPILFASLTTSVGLASLGFSPIRPIAAFGLAAAAGLLIQCAFALLLVPALFERWDQQTWVRRSGGLRWLDHLVRSLRDLGMRRAGWVVAITVLIMAAGAPFIARIQTETNLLYFFTPEAPIRQSTERIQERLIGVTSLEIILDMPARDGLKAPEQLRRIAELQAWLEAQPEVTRALSMVDLIEEMHWAFHEEDPAYRTLPDNRALIAQYLLIYDGRDLHELVDREFARARLTLNLNIHGARAINALIGRIRTQLAHTDWGEMQIEIAGFGRLFADQEQLLINGQLRSLIVAVVLISLLMLAMWRSLGAAALTMIPNLAPVLLIFIVMGALGIWLDMATAMIASVTVGIAVDDTIHLFHAYRRHRLAGRSAVWALARAYQHAGRALTATTVILCAQFLLLGASSFVPTVQFGLLTALGLVAALLFDLLFMPALIILLEPFKRDRKRVSTEPGRA